MEENLAFDKLMQVSLEEKRGRKREKKKKKKKWKEWGNVCDGDS